MAQDYGAVEDEDIDMMDLEFKYGAPDHVDQIYPARCDRDTGEHKDRNENADGRSAGTDGGGMTVDIGFSLDLQGSTELNNGHHSGPGFWIFRAHALT